MNKTMADDITDTVKEFGMDLVLQAIDASVDYRPGSWNYVRTVLIGLQEKQGRGQSSKQPEPTATPPSQNKKMVDWGPMIREAKRKAAS